MAVHDRIRLTGLLRKSPAQAGLFYDKEASEPVVAPDCAMKYLPREVARRKLEALVEGAAAVRTQCATERPR